MKKEPNLIWADKLLIIVMKSLYDNDGQMALRDLMREVGKEGDSYIPESQKVIQATGFPKWDVNLRWHSGILVSAGFLRRIKGIWHLTAEGEENLKAGEIAVIEVAKNAHKVKKAEQAKKAAEEAKKADEEAKKADEEAQKVDEEVQKVGDGSEQTAEANEEAEGDNEQDLYLTIESCRSEAEGEIKEHIRRKGPYEFQDLCAALLRGMNYYVRDIASPGPDGGIDILAYTDFLGGRPPRVKVQVKHTQAKTSRETLQALAGLLTEGDIGILISFSGFARGCRDFARNTSSHLELVDLSRFIELWQKCYGNLSEDDKSLLPLQSIEPIYFLDKKRAVEE